MVDMRAIYKEQLRLVKEIAEDIVKHNASKEIIEHANGYAFLENEYGESWRVNWGEAYAYVDLNKEGKPTGDIWWNNDEMGVEHDDTYEGTLMDLENMTIVEAYDKALDADIYDEYEDVEYILSYDRYVSM